MTAFLWGTALLVVAAYYANVVGPQTTWTRDAPSAEAIAAAMLLVQKAAVDWCLGTSACPDGAVPKAQLVLSPSYVAAPWIAVQAGGGWVSTYVTGIDLNALVIADKLNDLSEGGPSGGIVSPSLTVVARDLGQPGRIPVLVATGVPVGVPVVSEKVK